MFLFVIRFNVVGYAHLMHRYAIFLLMIRKLAKENANAMYARFHPLWLCAYQELVHQDKQQVAPNAPVRCHYTTVEEEGIKR